MICIVCEEKKECKHSLRLEKNDEGLFETRPICLNCRKGLIETAKENDSFIPIFSLEKSEEEVKKRNDEILLKKGKFQKILSKYGKELEKVKEDLPIQE